MLCLLDARAGAVERLVAHTRVVGVGVQLERDQVELVVRRSDLVHEHVLVSDLVELD